jgi:hypothetical protein
MIRNFLIFISLVICFPGLLSSQIDFKNAISKNIGSGIESVCTGDVNNDGLTDAIAATSFYFDPDHDYSIFVFLQRTNETLAPPIRYQYSEYYGSSPVVKVADVNNDQRNDIVYIYSDSLGIMYQNAWGTLDPPITIFTGFSPDGLDTGDLNNDGLTDIAISHWNSDYIRVYYQQPSGGFTDESLIIESRGWDELNVADMNGDGLDDVIFMPGQSLGCTLAIFYQDVQTGLSAIPVEYTYQAPDWYYTTFNGIGIGDLNNDGRNDIVGSQGGNSGSSFIAIIYQNTDGTLGEATFLPSYDIPTPVEIDDLNCDDKNEIIVGHDGWSHFSVWEQDEAGNFSDYELFGSLYYISPYGLAVGDINNDNRKDVISTSGFNYVYIMLNQSAPEGTLPIDTLVVYTSMEIDTINSYLDITHAYDTIQSGNCLISTYYQVDIMSYYIQEISAGDSLFPKSFNMCGFQQADTVTKHFENLLYYYVYHYDTTGVVYDTLLENPVNISNWVSIDTTSVNQVTYENYLIDYKYLFTNDSVFITTDSLKITNLYLEIEFLIKNYDVLSGTRCGEPDNDTVIHSYPDNGLILLSTDTVLISRTITGFPRGIDEQDISKNILLYPNPASDRFALEFENTTIDSGPLKIILIDHTGRVVREEEYPLSEKFSTVIERGSLSAGSYTLRLNGMRIYGIARVVFAPY